MGDQTKQSETTIEEEVGRVVEQAKELQEAAASFISTSSREEKELRQRARSLDESIAKLRSSISSFTNSLDPRLVEKLEDELNRANCILVDGDASSFLPGKVESWFLKRFLGPINVRAIRKDVQLKVKEEYNSYKDRTAYLFLLFPSILLILRSWMWDGCMPAFPVQLYQAWLLFLYTGLALRENILRVNGSDIRPWWIYHHYCAMVMALVSLTWEIKGQPDCAQKQRGVKLFLQWAMMQGVAMLLQNRYQRQRLYTRIALGKAKRMDIVWGETAGEHGQLWLLCPILFILQGFEAYVGSLLLQTAFVGFVSEWQVSYLFCPCVLQEGIIRLYLASLYLNLWQVVFCGFLLVLMAIGNFVNTVKTLLVKSRFKAKMKRTKSKQQLD
ncbi:transmembrane protein 120 homolog isoform X1 [Chenopodium quinoa]|uniref:transmembrane protein 120 homolog isoform X1 n=1 Tax=Chenopodium quinoa TaxID=63459 RepID=UPI000B76DB99|nr:transmembrane protein 120 homolog isoform X1 [Chenopodium quinoa]